MAEIKSKIENIKCNVIGKDVLLNDNKVGEVVACENGFITCKVNIEEVIQISEPIGRYVRLNISTGEKK